MVEETSAHAANNGARRLGLQMKRDVEKTATENVLLEEETSSELAAAKKMNSSKII